MSYHGLEVIDFHVHLPVWRAPAPKPTPTQLYAAERRRQWRREWDFPEPEDSSGYTDEEMTARWAAEVDKYGLSRVVLVTGGGNHHLAELIAPHRDKLVGLAHHDLAGPNPAEELARAVEEDGLKGYKVIAPALKLDSFDGPQLEPVWKYLEEHQLPLLIHFGWLGTGGGVIQHPLIDPLSIVGVATRHPALNIVVAHFGAGYFGELLQLCWSFPNIYADTSGSNQWMRWMPYRLELEDLFRKTYETIGPGRIVFGTDSSWFPRGFSVRYLQDQIRACRYVGMRDDDLALIFGGNAARLLHLEGAVGKGK